MLEPLQSDTSTLNIQIDITVKHETAAQVTHAMDGLIQL